VTIRLELDNVGVTYGATVALHPLSLVVEPGEFFCLLGPSGCGKSTTLGAVAGFVPVTSGRVVLNGKDVTHTPPQQRRIGVVFQSFALFPHMTAAENIGYGLRIRGERKAGIAARVAELVTLVHLQGKEHRKPRQMSGGEQQRVAIARSLAIEPQLLLLDEPLSSLDARLREEMRTELKRIQRTTGLTTIFVTHDQEEAFTISDRVAVMNQGRLEQVGTPSEIYRRPQTPFVASFIGRSNRLAGRAGGNTFEFNGHSFLCDHAPGAGRTNATWCLRPEEMRISDTGCANSVSARVLEVTYGGVIVTYRLDSEIGKLEVCQLSDASASIAVGQAVQVGWRPGSGALVPGEAPHG
jgi:putative spermidine/putrescine transport system ATP-binding protein